MGRIGEVICRTWQTADKMKLFRGQLAEEKVKEWDIECKTYFVHSSWCYSWRRVSVNIEGNQKDP